jgi:hypothetical protein
MRNKIVIKGKEYDLKESLTLLIKDKRKMEFWSKYTFVISYIYGWMMITNGIENFNHPKEYYAIDIGALILIPMLLFYVINLRITEKTICDLKIVISKDEKERKKYQ